MSNSSAHIDSKEPNEKQKMELRSFSLYFISFSAQVFAKQAFCADFDITLFLS